MDNKHVHGLFSDSYESNYLPFDDICLFIRKVVNKRNAIVFVKGLEKKKWLSGLISNKIVDLFDLECNILTS